MSLELDVQYAIQMEALPALDQFRAWAEMAVGNQAGVELVIRVVDTDEGAELNHRYRGKQGPTNVLSFPFEVPPGVDSTMLGDLVICAPVVMQEAEEQGKPPLDHWAHMVVHGVLHLQGYDHQSDEQTEAMEGLETNIMKKLGYADPYTDDD